MGNMRKDTVPVNTALEKQGEISEILYPLLASTYALYLKTQHCHWNVVGPQFYSFHLLFQSQYEELAEAIDEMAERIRALGFFPEGSFETFSKASFIPEADKPLSAMEMIQTLLEGHEALIQYMRKHLPFIEGEEDGATADFLNKRLVIHEKAAWILRSTIP